MKLKDEAWCFFSRKEKKYGTGARQIRKTKSGFWKITGKPKAIMRNREKIGEKKILMFYYSKQLGGSKTDWVIHEYHLFSPNQMMMTYTMCKVMSKGEEREISSSSASAASEVEQTHALIPNLSGGSEVGILVPQPTITEFKSVSLFKGKALPDRLLPFIYGDEDGGGTVTEDLTTDRHKT